DGEEAPLAANAGQLVRSTIDEAQTRPGDEILDRARNEHLARAGLPGDARAGVDGDTGHLAFHDLTFAGVQARTDGQAEIADGVDDRGRTPDCAGGTVERGEEAVAGRVEFPAAEAQQLAANERVMALEQIA